MRPSSTTAAVANTEFGARVRERRQAKRLSQRAVAELVGVDRRAYQGWEGGKHGITWENLDKLAEALEASADWLRLGDEGLQAIADERRRGPQPGITRVAGAIEDLRDALVDPPGDSAAFVAMALRDIQARLERIEVALGAAAGDETRAAINATRAVKEAASASAGDDPRATGAAAPARGAGDAKRGAGRAAREGKRSAGR